MKKLITVLLLLTALYGTAFAQNASDFVVDANGVITKYTGFDTVVVIPATIAGKKITAIGYEAFRKADITSVTIPSGITRIGDKSFADNKLTSVTIPDSVTSIGDYAFANNQLTSVTIPGSVKSIGSEAFRNNALSTIVIPEGVERIEIDAFANTGCKSVSLPSTIIYIGKGVDNWTGNPKFAFDISGKPSFTLAANINAEFDVHPAFYSYIANDRKAGTYAFDIPYKNADGYGYYQTQYGAVLTKYTGDSTRVRVPTEISGVAVKALYGEIDPNYNGRTGRQNSFFGIFEGKSIVAVQIPEGITYIGNCAFYENQLASVTIPNGVTYIGRVAFSENQLTIVTIPNGVMYIGDEAFSRNKLTIVTIPNGVTYIGSAAFAANQLTSVTIPDSVMYIGDEAFRRNKLTSVIIPNSVTIIRKGIFHENNLTSVTFQGTITASNFAVFDPYKSQPFPGDLREKYLAGGRGRYTYANGRWTKQQ
jgi:hypothetical protein